VDDIDDMIRTRSTRKQSLRGDALGAMRKYSVTELNPEDLAQLLDTPASDSQPVMISEQANQSSPAESPPNSTAPPAPMSRASALAQMARNQPGTSSIK